MLDHVSISHQSEGRSKCWLTSGGLILWSRSFTPAFFALASSSTSPINALVREALIEKAVGEDAVEKDGYNLRWTVENGLGLVFVVSRGDGKSSLQVVFPALLPLTYIPELLSRTKELFVSLFQPYLQTLADSLAAGNVSTTALAALQNQIVVDRWERIFDRCLRDCEIKKAGKPVSLHKQALTAASAPSSE
jgi:signal recognition particle receptor subunit alpha